MRVRNRVPVLRIISKNCSLSRRLLRSVRGIAQDWVTGEYAPTSNLLPIPRARLEVTLAREGLWKAEAKTIQPLSSIDRL